MDGVPYRQPLAGPESQYVPWGVLLVRPIGHPPRLVLTNGPGCIPPYCVCSGGADTVTVGAPEPLMLGPSPASLAGPLRPAPLFAVWFALVGFPSLRGGMVVVGGAFCFSWPCCLCACPHLPWSWFAAGVCVCGAVFARVVSVLVCVSCVRGAMGVGVSSVCVGVCVCVCGCVAGAGLGLLLVWVWVWLVCAVVGPWPLLAEVPECDFPPLLAGFRSRRWWVLLATPGWGPRVRFPATPGWGPLAAVVCVMCGVWCVVCGVRRWCVGGVMAGVWCGWSLATPGGGSCVLLPATPGWVSLPVVVGVPRHSWLRVPGAVPRHSLLGFAVGGGGCSSPFLAEGPGCGSSPLLAGVRWRRWCVVCGVWCVVCGVWCVVCGGCVSVGLWLVCGVVGPSPLLARFLFATPRHFWLGFDAGGGGRSSPLLAEGPGCRSPPLLAGVRWRRWCVVCGGWCVVCGVWW